MRFYHDADFETPVEWYFVPDDRETLPYAHAFYSRIYDRGEEPQEHLGERYAPVPWAGGPPPRIVSHGGLCGTRDQWERGCSIADLLPQLWPNTKVGRCCLQPKPQGIGGMGEGSVAGSCANITDVCPGVELGPALLLSISEVVGPTCPLLVGQYVLVCDPASNGWIGEYVVNGKTVKFKLDFRITDLFTFCLQIWMDDNYTRSFGILNLVCNPFFLELQFLVGPTFFPVVCAGGIVDTFMIGQIEQL